MTGKPGKSESVESHYPNKDVDWDTPFRGSPSSDVGEFGSPRATPFTPDRTALTFTETSRTPYDGDESRSQGKFPTNDAPDQKGR